MKLQSEQTKKIKEVFIKIDSSKDGLLTLEEIKTGMREVLDNMGTGFDWQ